jgi:protein subunit release factor B
MASETPLSRKRESLALAMRRLGILEADLEEQFVSSSGPGGQNVNKVATCVLLKHRLSGIQIRCQKERSQVRNRVLARRLLVERLETIERQQRQAHAHRLSVLRRQRRRRPAAVRQQLLAAKRRRQEKKQLRRRLRREPD